MGEESDIQKKSEHEKVQSNRDELLHYWANEIQRALKRSSKWFKRAADVVDTYRGIYEDNAEVFNILWSNTEVLKALVYNSPPKPEVERKFLEDDPFGMTMAIVMERSIESCMDYEGREFHKVAKKIRDDFLLPGRGVGKVVYDADFETIKSMKDDVNEKGEKITVEVEEEIKTSEMVWTDYVYWRDFLHSYGRQWDEVWWVAFASNYTREACVEEFGEEIGRAIPLCGEIFDKENFYNSEGEFDYGLALQMKEHYARIWEIWDKSTRQVLIIAEGYDKIIDKYDDPYELEEFFPTPEPVCSITTTGSLIPVPEYTMYQYQANELNVITRRITNLTDALKARGVCDADIKALVRLFDGEENTIIPDEEFSKLVAAGGTKGAIEWAPIETIAQVIAILEPRRRETLDIIYEITGISDIMRGSSEQYETATAVNKKVKHGSIRVHDRQEKLANYYRDLLRIMGNVAAELFDPETFIMLSGVQNDENSQGGMDKIFQLLRDGEMRNYIIDIQTDSTIALTDFDRKEELSEFFTAISALMKDMIPAVENGTIPQEVARQFLLYAARRYEVGRDLYDAIEMIGQEGEKGPSPEDQQANKENELAQQALQIEQQKLALEEKKMMLDFQIDQAKLQIEVAKLMNDRQMNDADNQVRLAAEMIKQKTVEINARGGAN
jgi:hypothetical protein